MVISQRYHAARLSRRPNSVAWWPQAEVGHLSPTELVMMDSKTFEIGGKKLRISVIETTKPQKVLRHQEALQQSMAEVRVAVARHSLGKRRA